MNTNLFTGKAEVYAQARPSYAAEAIDYICSLAPQDAVFADIGAGTGKLSELLARCGNILYAVEPNDDMRLQLEKTLEPYHNARVLNGTAENTNLPTAGVDVITVAQALHWFEPATFLKECLRVLRPEGFVVAVYNTDPKSEGPVHSKTSTDKFFDNHPVIREFSNPVYYTRENWIAYRLSHSHDPKPGEERFKAYIAEVNGDFDRNNVEGLIKLDLMTTVYTSGGKRP
ncbi:class I SAM-dependent methyltransferase [Konateibacter massiliensis]|uniref:class I SAM-dependent methyltransferase n=1 Tax=Konateibacter massiliensis TaxID=2002841 RepID=UPI000C15DEE6|nr:class I SAM-dependent methyltransferase [Konateibacter massiliensis]